MKTRSRSAAFTLLELVAVLAILAIVTALAVRSLDGVIDQRRYETSQRGLQEINDAVLGSPDDRAPDGSRTVSGFVADMGRLPKTNVSPISPGELEVRELWENPGVNFDVRQAKVENGVPADHADPQVVVAGGWHGPYLHLPINTRTLLDGWGNSITSPMDPSPPDPDTTGYARLRNGSNTPITAAAQEVRTIHILGANGRLDPDGRTDSGYDQDASITFNDDQVHASISGYIYVYDGTALATADNSYVVVRVFGPSAANAAQISVASTPFALPPPDPSSTPLQFTATSPAVPFSIPVDAGVTIGPRTICAYLYSPTASGTLTAGSGTRGVVKRVTLRGGPNSVDLAIIKP